MMKRNLITAALAGLAMAAAAPGAAQTVVKHYSFTAQTAGPISNHSGSFSYSYDKADPLNLTLLSIDFTLNGLSYDLSTASIFARATGKEGDFVLYGLTNDIGVVPGFTDFFLGNDRGPIPDECCGDFFVYSVDFDQNGFWTAGERYVGLDPEVGTVSINAVPEPASWAMLVAGFGLIGAALRRRTAAARIVSA